MEKYDSREKEPNIQVGLASPQDAEGIRDVQRDTWLATYPTEEYGITKEDIESKDWNTARRVEQWREIISEENPNNAIWVAKQDAKVVGFCAALKDNKENHLRAIYVLPVQKLR